MVSSTHSLIAFRSRNVKAKLGRVGWKVWWSKPERRSTKRNLWIWVC